MKSAGHKNFRKTPTGKYEVPSLQTRWKYFLLGWELREANT